MRKPNNIRNISIFADDQSGRSTIIANLYERYGIKKQSYAGMPCYTDSLEEECEAGTRSTAYLDYIRYFHYEYAHAISDDSESD